MRIFQLKFILGATVLGQMTAIARQASIDAFGHYDHFGVNCPGVHLNNDFLYAQAQLFLVESKSHPQYHQDGRFLSYNNKRTQQERKPNTPDNFSGKFYFIPIFANGELFEYARANEYTSFGDLRLLIKPDLEFIKVVYGAELNEAGQYNLKFCEFSSPIVPSVGLQGEGSSSG